MDEWSETVSQKSKNHKHPFNFTFCTPEVVHLLSIDTTEHSGPGSFPLHTSTRSHKKDVISLCFLKTYRLKQWRALPEVRQLYLGQPQGLWKSPPGMEHACFRGKPALERERQVRKIHFVRLSPRR